jgi:ribosome-associated protein
METLNEDKLLSECVITFTRSSGAGGQNVNKVSTKVEMRFDISASVILNEKQKLLIISRLKNHSALIRMTSGRERSQMANLKLVSKRFIEKINQLLLETPERIATLPSKSSKENRLNNKKRFQERNRKGSKSKLISAMISRVCDAAYHWAIR